MTVKPLIRIIDAGGWKHDKNKRFGAVVVGIFETYNASNGEVKVFHFAPTLQDLVILEQLIKAVREVDTHNKAVYTLKAELENLTVEVKEC